jgi:hypothetical protein
MGMQSISLSPKVTATMTATALAALALGGCGLISSDVFRVTFDLPVESYTFDTAQWGTLPPAAVGTFPSISCTPSADTTSAECCTLGAVAGIDCATTPLTCPSGSCEADVPASQSTTIDLATDVKPSLAQYTSLASITISSISYMVSNNTLNIDLPPVSIYLAPGGVTDSTDARAVLFGTVPQIPAGTNPSAQVQLVANSGAVFQMFTSNLSMPFNFIAATTVKIVAGTPVPSGHLTIAVTGTLSAQP